jgi:hypothetical protein
MFPEIFSISVLIQLPQRRLHRLMQILLLQLLVLLQSKPPSAYFDDLIAFLKAYRDGDSNCPTFAPAARAPTQLETAFAPASNSSPVMGEEY